MDKKQQTLLKISEKLEQVRTILDECRTMADDAEVVFHFNVLDSSWHYYPESWKPENEYDEDYWAGRWVSSSELC